MAKKEHSAGLFHPDPQIESESVEPIKWTASEFIAHQKTAVWYLLLILVCVVLAGLVLLFTHDKVSAAVVIIAGLVLAVYANRQPRQLSYRLDGHNLNVGERTYSYQAFRSFSMVPEGPFASIIFWPLKRFSPAISIYFDPADGDKILELLTPRLPQEQPRSDPIDSLMRRIRF